MSVLSRLFARVKKMFSRKKANQTSTDTQPLPTPTALPLPTSTTATHTHAHTHGEDGCAVCEDFGLMGCRNPFVLPSSVSESSSAATLVAPLVTAPAAPGPSAPSASTRPRPVSGPVPTHNDYYAGMGYDAFFKQACMTDLADKAAGKSTTVNVLTNIEHNHNGESTSEADSSSETLANWVAAATQLDEGPQADSATWNRQAVYVPRQARPEQAEAGDVEILADDAAEVVEQSPRVDTPTDSEGSIHGTGASAPQMVHHNPNVFGFDAPQRSARNTNRWGFHAGSPAMTAPPSLYAGPSECQSPVPNTAAGDHNASTSSLDVSTLSRALESIRDLNGLHEDPSPHLTRQVGFPTQRHHEDDEDDSATGPAVLADDGSEADTDVSSLSLNSAPRGRPVWNNPASRITDYAGSEVESEAGSFQAPLPPFQRVPAHRDTFGAPSPATYPTAHETGRGTPQSERFDPVAQADELDDEGFPAYDASQYEPTPHRDFENQTPGAGSSTQRGTAHAEAERLSLNRASSSLGPSEQPESDPKAKAKSKGKGKGKGKQRKPANKDKDLPPSPADPAPEPTPTPDTSDAKPKVPKPPVEHPPQRPGQSDADYYKECILRDNGRGSFYRKVSGLHTDPAVQLHHEGLSSMMPILERVMLNRARDAPTRPGQPFPDYPAYPARAPPHLRLPVQHQRPNQQLGTQGFPPSLARPRLPQQHQRQSSRTELPYQEVLAQVQAAQRAAREQQQGQGRQQQHGGEQAQQQGGEQGETEGRGRRNWKQVQKQPPT